MCSVQVMGDLDSIYENICEFVAYGLKNGDIMIMPSQCMQRVSKKITKINSEIQCMVNLRLMEE